jgi:hypothetical protein
MPRIARIVAVDVPHHMTKRVNHRASICVSDQDRHPYLELLATHFARQRTVARIALPRVEQARKHRR